MENSVIIGKDTFSEHENVCLIGDNLVARWEGDIQIGTILWDEPLPEELKFAFKDYGPLLRGLIIQIFKPLTVYQERVANQLDKLEAELDD